MENMRNPNQVQQQPDEKSLWPLVLPKLHACMYAWIYVAYVHMFCCWQWRSKLHAASVSQQSGSDLVEWNNVSKTQVGKWKASKQTNKSLFQWFQLHHKLVLKKLCLPSFFVGHAWKGGETFQLKILIDTPPPPS
jgi:hypothetical protein